MKKVFEIECPDGAAEVWLDASTIYATLQNHPHLNCVNVTDITDGVQKLRRVMAALIDESLTRIPPGFDQKDKDYVMRVNAHNKAMMEVAQALYDIGYRQ